MTAIASKSIAWLKAHTQEGTGFALKSILQAILFVNLLFGILFGELALIYYLCTGHL